MDEVTLAVNSQLSHTKWTWFGLTEGAQKLTAFDGPYSMINVLGKGKEGEICFNCLFPSGGS